MERATTASPADVAEVERKPPPPTPPDRGSSEAEPAEDLRGAIDLESLYACHTQRETLRRGLELVAAHFDAGYAVLRADLADGTVEDHVELNASSRRAWRKICEGQLLNARFKRHAAARFYRAEGYSGRLAVLAAPFKISTLGMVAAMAIVVPCRHPQAAQAKLNELTALLTAISAAAAGKTGKPTPADTDAESTAVSAGLAKGGNQSLQEFAFSLANGLKSKLGCDQVALGVARRNGIKLMCISGFDQLYPRSPGSMQLQQAMCECLDAEQLICFQTEPDTTLELIATGHRLHAQWHLSVGNQPVASIPLIVRGTTVAVVSLRNPAGRNFTREKLGKVQEVLQPLAANLLLLEQANKGIVRHVSDILWGALAKFGERGRWRRRILAVLLVFLALWVTFGKRDYTISVPCLVEPREERHVSAPYEGQLASAFVRPGDTVRAGQLVAVLDTRELLSERSVLRAGLRIAEVDMARAVAQRDLAVAAQAEAEAQRTRSRLRMVERRIASSEIRAACDGVVVEGDLAPRVGEIVPLGEPLLRIAEAGAWKLRLHVPEYAATLIAVDELGEVALAARPDTSMPLRIRRLEAESVAHDGSNVFVAEAELDGATPEWWRSGMEGVARVEVGRHPIWWVWLHRVINGVRLQLWKL